MNFNDPIIEGFYEYCLGVKKLKATSVRDLKCSINKLQKYLILEKCKDFIWELELDQFVDYVNYLRDRGERGTGISKQLSHLRSLLDYCHKAGYAKKNPLYGYEVKDKSPKYQPRFLTMEEMTSLLRVLSKKTRVERKERLMVLTLYGLGLRTSELCNLKVKDISIEDQDVFIRGKFDIERRIPVPDGLWIELLSYLQENDLKRGQLFKTDSKKTKYNISAVGFIVKKYASLAELSSDITPKTLRHTFASHLMDKGIDISIISSLMGHKSPRETGVYVHAYKKNKDSAISHFDNIYEEEE